MRCGEIRGVLPSSRTSIMAMVGSPAAAASWAVRRVWEREAAERRWRVPIVVIFGRRLYGTRRRYGDRGRVYDVVFLRAG